MHIISYSEGAQAALRSFEEDRKHALDALFLLSCDPYRTWAGEWHDGQRRTNHRNGDTRSMSGGVVSLEFSRDPSMHLAIEYTLASSNMIRVKSVTYKRCATGPRQQGTPHRTT